MSVTGVETNEREVQTNPIKGTLLCQGCHLTYGTSMNIGLPERGYCKQCGQPNRLYMVV